MSIGSGEHRLFSVENMLLPDLGISALCGMLMLALLTQEILSPLFRGSYGATHYILYFLNFTGKLLDFPLDLIGE